MVSTWPALHHHVFLVSECRGNRFGCSECCQRLHHHLHVSPSYWPSYSTHALLHQSEMTLLFCQWWLKNAVVNLCFLWQGVLNACGCLGLMIGPPLGGYLFDVRKQQHQSTIYSKQNVKKLSHISAGWILSAFCGEWHDLRCVCSLHLDCFAFSRRFEIQT